MNGRSNSIGFDAHVQLCLLGACCHSVCTDVVPPPSSLLIPPPPEGPHTRMVARKTAHSLILPRCAYIHMVFSKLSLNLCSFMWPCAALPPQPISQHAHIRMVAPIAVDSMSLMPLLMKERSHSVMSRCVGSRRFGGWWQQTSSHPLAPEIQSSSPPKANMK